MKTMKSLKEFAVVFGALAVTLLVGLWMVVLFALLSPWLVVGYLWGIVRTGFILGLVAHDATPKFANGLVDRCREKFKPTEPGAKP